MNGNKISEDKTFNALKARHRELRESFDESFSIRIHRALSWLERAEKEADDADVVFYFLLDFFQRELFD